eukprot:scaffold1525_cov128-Isochrysis_galbana.AAC.3
MHGLVGSARGSEVLAFAIRRYRKCSGRHGRNVPPFPPPPLTFVCRSMKVEGDRGLGEIGESEC